MIRSSRTHIALGILLALILLCLGYAYFIEPHRLVVNEQAIELGGWQSEFDGFRAVLISDIHGGSNGVDEAKLQQIVAEANVQAADMIVLLGDYVSQAHEDIPIRKRSLKTPMETIAAHLAGLRAKNGVFAVLGNHDGWFSSEKVKSELERVGINVLDHELAFIERDGKRIRILGLRDHQTVDDWNAFSMEARKLLADNEGTGSVIVLEHSPDVLPMITGEFRITRDPMIMFAGHTHGGQVWLPVLGRPVVPSTYGQKYAAGYVKDAGVDMFVTTGIGTSILPIRFLVPPEIAVITIRSKTGD